MTAREQERLAKLEEKTDNIVEKLDSVLAKLDNLDDKFVTRREFAAIKWVIGIVTAGGTAVATFLLTRK